MPLRMDAQQLDQTVIHVPIKRLPGCEDIPLPGYQSAFAAGMDLHAAVDTPLRLEPGRIALVPCGFAIAVPPGYEAQIRPRSGLAVKCGLSMPNTPGTVDADYRGQIQVPLINHGHAPFVIERAMRIAQMIIKPVPRTCWREVDHLPDSQRGEAGFGHTGH